MASAARKVPTSIHDKEIDSVLNRLHSGSRFITFVETVERGSGKPSEEDWAQNVLRNSSHPDEVHAELGRALGHSYVSSSYSIASLLSHSANGKVESNAEVQAAIKRGVRIIQSLVCGVDVSEDDKNESHQENYNKANYASAAYSFFDQVAKSLFFKDEKIDGGSVEEVAIRSFVQNQWQQWCIKCEEFAYIKEGTKYTGGGGIHVLNACMKGFSSICFENVSCSESDGNLDNFRSGSGSLYQSLSQSASRMFWIRACVSNAMEKVRTEKIQSDKLLVHCLSPLFYACVLQAGHESQQHQEPVQIKHAERQLLLREMLWRVSLLLHGVNGDERIINQLACMVKYLSTSLQSYLGQVSMSICSSSSSNEIATSDLLGFAYDWLRGISDIMKLMVTNSQLELSLFATNKICTSAETVFRYVLPQITSSINFTPVPFEMTSVYAALRDIAGSFQAENLLQMADPALALDLGTLALSIEDEQELNILCNLIFSIFCGLDKEDTDGDVIQFTRCTYVPSVSTLCPVKVDSPATPPSASNLLWTGGILCALGCLFLPRPLTGAGNIKNLGVSLLRNANVMAQSGGEKVDEIVNEHVGQKCLIDIFSYLSDKESEQFQFMIKIMSSSIANVDEESVLLYKWKRRPLSLSDQHGALLIGLSLLHVSLSSTSVETIQLHDAFSYLSTLLKCHPHISARAVPSIIDVVRTCIAVSDASSLHLLLEAIKFLASPAIVSDPHGASIAWNFLSSLTSDSVPPTVRSSVLRVLPDMCASNKKLRSRINAGVGKALTSTDPTIRTAAMATLSDLANRDLLRDVEDVVGWVQAGLKDEEASVIYFALMSLKYLVSNDELEFDLVIRVLEKRLDVNVENVAHVTSVLGNGIVLEGFINLLAEAGFEEGESDDEDADEKEGQRVSPKSELAVSFLVNLFLTADLSLKSPHDQHLDPSSPIIVRVQSSILKILAGYNTQLLGLDAESIRAAAGAGASDDEIAVKKRYDDVKRIVMAGHQFASASEGLYGTNISSKDVVESVTSLMTTLLQFEEEVHGSALFRGTAATASDKTNKPKSDSVHRIPKAVLSSLPDYKTIIEMYDDEPKASTATAVMCSDTENNTSVDEMLCRLSELFTDFASERFSEPHLQAIQIYSLLDCMGKLRLVLEYSHEQEEMYRMAIKEIKGWASTNGEYAHVALASFVLGSGESSEVQAASAEEVAKIQNTIMDGCDSLMFETEEVKLLCLCLVAAKLSHSADSRATRIIDRLEKYIIRVNKADSQVSSGVIVGMSVLVKNLMQDGSLNRSHPSDDWRWKQSWRIIALLLSSINNCLTISNTTICSLITCIETGKSSSELDESFAELEELFIKPRSIHTMQSLLISLGNVFSQLAVLDAEASKCILRVMEKLPWSSGKAFVLSSAYKSCMDNGILSQSDTWDVISEVSSLVEGSTGDDRDLGHVLYALANLCELSSAEEMEKVVGLVKERTLIIMNEGRDLSSDVKQMALLSAVSLIGGIPGLSPMSLGVHYYAKKELVLSTAKLLTVIVTSDSEDSKTIDTAAIGLGLMSGMKRSDKKVKHKSREKSKNSVNFDDILQSKEDTMLFSILTAINASYSTAASIAVEETRRKAAAKKLPPLLKSLEAIAVPGNIGRVIEVVLNDCGKIEAGLKSSCIELLASQLVSRRRVGFDGRGFLDLYVRLVKMAAKDLHKLIGPDNVPTMMTALPNIISQLPTSSGEEVLMKTWTACQFDLAQSFRTQSAVEFFIGVRRILLLARSSEKKNVTSPAILRCIQKLVTTSFFQDICQYAGPSPKNIESTLGAEKLWTAYTECLNELSDSTVISESDIGSENLLFGMCMCTAGLMQPYTMLRKVEVYISRHEWLDDSERMRMALTSLVALGVQCSDVSLLKESVMDMFDLMLVKSVGTVSIEVLAIKVAFWWESLNMNRIGLLEFPSLQVSTRSSLLLTRNLCFKIQAWPSDLIIEFFDSCIADLAPKLAVLCQLWKISDDVCNRASRILSAASQEPQACNARSRSRQNHVLACLKRVVQLLRAGEP